MTAFQGDEYTSHIANSSCFILFYELKSLSLFKHKPLFPQDTKNVPSLFNEVKFICVQSFAVVILRSGTIYNCDNE